MTEKKWFVCKNVGYREWVEISEGFYHKEVARVEFCRMVRELNLDPFNPGITIMERKVEKKKLSAYYDVCPEYGFEFTSSKILDAYEEYRISEEW